MLNHKIEATPVSATSDPFEGWPVIHSYTRADALKDGTLVDVSTQAATHGFKVPVALTSAAYEKFVQWTQEDENSSGHYQDESGRLGDVLWMLRVAIKGARADATTIDYPFYSVPRGVSYRRKSADGIEPVLSMLRAVIGPGDDPAPVFTIMLTSES